MKLERIHINPSALRMAKTLWSIGPSECSRVNQIFFLFSLAEYNSINVVKQFCGVSVTYCVTGRSLTRLHTRYSTNKLYHFNPVALRKAKIICNFGLSEYHRLIFTDLFQ